MKILWTVNLVPKDAAQGLGISSDVLGGWVETMASRLKKIEGVQLAVACKTDFTPKMHNASPTTGQLMRFPFLCFVFLSSIQSQLLQILRETVFHVVILVGEVLHKINHCDALLGGLLLGPAVDPVAGGLLAHNHYEQFWHSAEVHAIRIIEKTALTAYCGGRHIAPQLILRKTLGNNLLNLFPDVLWFVVVYIVRILHGRILRTAGRVAGIGSRLVLLLPKYAARLLVECFRYIFEGIDGLKQII